MSTFTRHGSYMTTVCQAFSSEKAIEPIIDLMQSQPLQDPIPWSIWQKITRDEYVDFEHLYGSTDPNYSHKDDHKEFAGGYICSCKERSDLFKKIHSYRSRLVSNFSAWEAGVLLLYPHQQIELQRYCILVVDLFCATPHNASTAICFDIKACDCYVGLLCQISLPFG